MTTSSDEPPDTGGLASLSEDSVICMAGDWHGDARAAVARIEHAAERGANVICHVGDFGIAQPRYTDRYIGAVGRALAAAELVLWLVPGNHDSADVIEALPRTQGGLQKFTNRLLVVPRAWRWSWAGYTYMGLSGAVSVDRNRLTPGRTWWPQEAMTDDDVDRATVGSTLVDVVVSHDVPTSVNVPGLGGSSRWPADALADAAAHRDRLELVAQHVKPRVWVAGHHHRRYTARIDLGYDERRLDHAGTMTVYGLADQQASIRDNLVFLHPNGDLVKE